MWRRENFGVVNIQVKKSSKDKKKGETKELEGKEGTLTCGIERNMMRGTEGKM